MIKKKLDLFGKRFKKYNDIIGFLIMPLTLLAAVTKTPIFMFLLLIELILLVINAIYIICKLCFNKKNKGNKETPMQD